MSRSSLECHLFMELHPCECGEARGPSKHKLVSRGEDLVAAYEDACAGCGRMRSFEFVLDPELVRADKFGGSRPSTIIDAGQYMWVAEQAAKQVPVNASTLGGDDRRRASWFMERAVSAMEEVLKFIPVGVDQLPHAALFTDQGRAVYGREAGRFRRSRLEAVLDAYREMQAEIDGKPSPRSAPANQAMPAQPQQTQRQRKPTMEILPVTAQPQPQAGERKRKPTMEILPVTAQPVPTLPAPSMGRSDVPAPGMPGGPAMLGTPGMSGMPAGPAMLGTPGMPGLAGPGTPGMPAGPGMPGIPGMTPAMPGVPMTPGVPFQAPRPPLMQSASMHFTAAEAQARRLPPIGFRVEGVPMSLTKFPEPDKYLIASGPPGAPLLAIVWTAEERESHVGAVEAAVRRHFSQPWQQPLVIGEAGSVAIGGVARPALAFVTGQQMRRTAWCGVLVSGAHATVLVTLGRASGQAAAMSCGEVMMEPSLAAFARTFALLP